MSYSQREIESGREYRAFVAEEERIEREKIERPIRQAQEALQKTAREFGLKMREIVLTGADPEWVTPASVAGKRMSIAQAKEFNAAEAKKFHDSCDEYRERFNTPENRTVIIDYVLRNGVQIANAEVFQLAYERCRDLGLLTERIPEPEPEIIPIEPTIEPTPVPRLDRHKKIISWRGSELSLFEIERRPADEFRAILRAHPELENEL